MSDAAEHDYLARLQAEADKYGYHRVLRAWVGDDSSVARMLRARCGEAGCLPCEGHGRVTSSELSADINHADDTQ